MKKKKVAKRLLMSVEKVRALESKALDDTRGGLCGGDSVVGAYTDACAADAYTNGCSPMCKPTYAH